MNVTELDAVEAGWDRTVPDVTKDESPETALAVKAHGYFQEKILLASGIRERAKELALDGVVTTDNYGHAKVIAGMCRRARGDIERNRKLANEDALAWQRAINARAKELVAEVEVVEAPYKTGIKQIDDEKERAKREKEEAERKEIEDAALARVEAERALEDEKRAREAEANRIEAERLKTERAAMEEEQRKLNAELDAKLAEQKRISDEHFAAGKAERDKLEAELAQHRAEKEAMQKAERDRVAAALKAEGDRLVAEQAEAERVAAAEREAARLESIQPDIAKVRMYGTLIGKVKAPSNLTSDEANAVVNRVRADLAAIASALAEFGSLVEIIDKMF